MKRTAKRILCILLCAMMIASPLIGSYAAGKEAVIPIISVRGIGDQLYKNLGTDEQEPMFPPSNDAILKLVGDMVLPLGKLAATRNWDAFARSLASAMNVFFEGFGMNPDGSAPEGTGIDWEYPEIKEKYTKGDVYKFTYDWRLDPYEIAAQLNDYIEYICKGVGCDKVVLRSHSMGGVVTAAYVCTYGYDRVYSVVMDSTVLAGASIAGEAFSGKIEIEGSSLTRTINQYLPANEIGALVESIINLLQKAGVMNGVADAADYIVDKVIDILYEETLTPIFATCPGMWALVNASEYNAAKQKLLGGKPEYAELIKRIDKYHNNIRLHYADILKSIPDKGIILIIISKYDLQVAPVIEDWNISSDGVVDSVCTSFGAVCAPVGETLPFPYIQKKVDGHMHISPDLKVDASTCLFPEYTWFVKGLGHSDQTDDFIEMWKTLALSETQPTVHTYKQYPQFLTYDKAGGRLTVTRMPDLPKCDSYPALVLNIAVSSVRFVGYLIGLICSAI